MLLLFSFSSIFFWKFHNKIWKRSSTPKREGRSGKRDGGEKEEKKNESGHGRKAERGIKKRKEKQRNKVEVTRRRQKRKGRNNERRKRERER